MTVEERARVMFHNFMTLKRLRHQQLSECMFIQKHTLTPAQLEALFAVKELQPVTFTQLAEHLMQRRAAVTQLYDALERSGYVNRTICEDDRRTSHITLTELGHDLFRHMEPFFRQQTSLVTDALTADEIETFIALQEKLIARLRAEPERNQ